MTLWTIRNNLKQSASRQLIGEKFSGKKDERKMTDERYGQRNKLHYNFKNAWVTQYTEIQSKFSKIIK